jgi:D-glycerate 3-kinase
MTEIFDDKSQYCIPFLLDRLKEHQTRYADDHNAPPFFLGLNGVQGVGKTVLVISLPYAGSIKNEQKSF